MSKRLDIDDPTISEIFGVDVDARRKRQDEDERVRVRFVANDEKTRRAADTVAKPTRVGQVELRIRFAKWCQDHPLGSSLALIGSGVAVGGLAVALLAPNSQTASPEVASGHGGPPPPPPPRRAPIEVGATLEVDTRRTRRGRPVPGQLRAEPGLDAARTAEVPNGAIVSVLGNQESGSPPATWYRVRVPGGVEGWMHSEILR